MKNSYNKIIMVCGSRGYQNKQAVTDWASHLDPDNILIHGNCPNSPDVWAGDAAAKIGIIIGKFSANWDYFGKRAGYMRNYVLVDIADTVVVFWDGESKGTKNVIDYAVKVNKPLEVIR